VFQRYTRLELRRPVLEENVSTEEKLTVAQQLKKSLSSCGTWKLITVFTIARHWFLS
jgi:hypothetical protein